MPDDHLTPLVRAVEGLRVEVRRATRGSQPESARAMGINRKTLAAFVGGSDSVTYATLRILDEWVRRYRTPY